MRLVCATANSHKVTELSRMLPEWVTLVPRPLAIGDVEETAPTLEGNAIIKAVEVANFADEWAIADDTGLEVLALQGDPGVHSARFAGDHATDAENRALLIERMRGVEDRRARFRTVMALVNSGGEIHVVSGECTGTISETEKGQDGFGYDAIFVPDGLGGRTFAQMSAEEKDAVSHRGNAIAQLPALLARIFGLPTP